MTVMLDSLQAFHLLRPWLLLVLIPIALIWWHVRGGAQRSSLDTSGIATHLANALTIRSDRRTRILPIDISMMVLALLVLAASGPTWSRVPDPFAAQTAPMIVVLQVTPSMENPDVAPSRLERAKQKVRDLLALRSGARTALVAFSGSAHSVVPMTEDPRVVQPYLDGLSPDVMPEEGFNAQAALELSTAILSRENAAGGSVLFLLDDLQPGALQPSAEDADVAPNLGFLFFRPQGTALPATPADAVAERVTPDETDITRIERALSSAYRRAQLEDGTQPWQDRGGIFAWPAALLLLYWFRRGVTMRWVVVLAVVFLLHPNASRAEGWRDWFLTPDQQGWLAFRNKNYDTAATLFMDPYLRGVALYKDGQYEAAAELFGRIETADAAFAAGMAHIKSRGYRDGVRSFQRALELDPSHEGATQNLPIAQEIVTYVEETRAQSDTGEESGIGADDTVFDNESGEGVETQIEASEEAPPQHLTTEQWMNTVDTDTGDFLRQRFRLELSEGSK